MRKLFFCLFLMCFFFAAYAQSDKYQLSDEYSNSGKWWIFFSDKSGTSFDPYTYFDPKAIERRVRQGLPVCDSTDFPVSEIYISTVKNLVDSVSWSSRWLNAVAVYANSEQIGKVRKLSYVANAEPMQTFSSIASLYNVIPTSEDGETDVENPVFDTLLSSAKRELLINQTERMGSSFFAKKNIDGRGIRVAIFDAGFPSVDFSPAFMNILRENRLIKTYDFVKKRPFVFSYSSHGTSVMSCVGGLHGDIKIGLATGAEFLLARTEIAAREPFAEEEYWAAAMEWADQNGAHIINSSLAYTYHRYFTSDMNGRKSLVARVANMAAAKGMLVVNAAGNDGSDNTWRIIATPADADSVLTVGGISPKTNYHIRFSSYGPTSDKRMKPNVVAYGQVIASGKNNFVETFGTSFSSPLTAGFAACALQLNPDMKPLELLREIEKSADMYPYYDYAHGYGVPQASHFTKEKTKATPLFEIVQDTDSVKVVVKNQVIDELEKFGSDSVKQNFLKDISNDKSNILFYHTANASGQIDNYYVVKVQQTEVLKIDRAMFPPGKKLSVHFRGHTETVTF